VFVHVQVDKGNLRQFSFFFAAAPFYYKILTVKTTHPGPTKKKTTMSQSPSASKSALTPQAELRVLNSHWQSSK
jgi:hypothetical protein